MGKDLSCEGNFLRGALLVLNVLFIIVGLALIGIGIYVKVDKNFALVFSELADLSSLEAKSLGYLAFILIGGGIFTLLIALAGCMGALWEKSCFLYMYAVILLILMILELAGCIMALVYKGKIKDVYGKSLHDALLNALKNNKSDAIKSFHKLEDEMKCCGVFNISDYPPEYSNQESDWCKKDPNPKGCLQAILDFLGTNLPMIGGILGGVLLIELFGFVGAIALAVAVRNASDRYQST